VFERSHDTYFLMITEKSASHSRSHKLTVMGKYSRKYVHMRQLLTHCDLRPPHEGVSLSRYSQPAYSAPRIHQSLTHKSTNKARQTWAGDRET